jgi:hypothetical protein
VRHFVLPTSLAIGVSSLQTTSFVGQAVLVVVLVLEFWRAECWSTGVLRLVRIASRYRGVGIAFSE